MTRYLSELAYVAVREGWPGFKLNLTYLMYEIEHYERPEGFTFQDIVEHFCWVSICTYYFDDSVKPNRWLRVRLPRSMWLG